MSRRPLPSEEEARRILAQRRTKPPLRPPPRAAHKLQKFIKELDQKFGRSANSLEARWAEIVGERMARVSRPQKIIKGKGNAGGVLELRVVGPAALLVQHQQQEIIEQVNLYLGANAVEKIRIQQGPVKPLVAAPSAPKSRKLKPLPPISPAAEAELEESVAHLPEHLRKALTKLGKAAIVRTQEEQDDPYR
ncbi:MULTISPECIES: DUF721 domain-containing protein [unclassified Brevundimonas]|uniref:DUF721 domain-containing protein n=1 Tax=unclassified Brevundimonas TaxID=2622653 RepID=UPI0025B7F025|nr:MULTISPECIES: DciA family protein [unclassified Brevundimonas]